MRNDNEKVNQKSVKQIGKEKEFILNHVSRLYGCSTHGVIVLSQNPCLILM